MKNYLNIIAITQIKHISKNTFDNHSIFVYRLTCFWFVYVG